MNMHAEETEAATIARIAREGHTAPQEIEQVDDLIGIVLPDGSRFETLDLRLYQDTPRRKTGHLTMFTAESLAAYVVAHKTTGTALYANVEGAVIVAVLNGHTPEDPEADSPGWNPGWGDHRVQFAARLTSEWKAWNEINGAMKSQKAFAEFLEDHVADVISPTAADMLELVKTFEAKTNVDFKSAVRLDNDTRQLTYVETTDARAGTQGQMEIPGSIDLALAPFEGSEPYRITARFRYRIEDGHLKLGVVLDRPDVVLRSAFDDVLAIVESTTGLSAYRGLAPE